MPKIQYSDAYSNRSAKLDVLGGGVEKHCRAFLHVRSLDFFDFAAGGFTPVEEDGSLIGHVTLFFFTTKRLHVMFIVHVIYM